MSRRCQTCGKKPIIGSSVSRRGLAKKVGGIGKKITGISRRIFLPNLQRRKVLINGKIKRIIICTKCIKKGKVTFAVEKSK